MAGTQFSAPSGANAGAANTLNSGVIHVRTRLTADFTVIANALAQRRGSAVTIGVAAYILSVADGAPVSIAALCAHFDEGEILISRALRELEAAGYLERRKVRGPKGTVRTLTFFYDVPPGAADRPPPPSPPLPPQPTRPRGSAPVANSARAAGPAGEPAAPEVPDATAVTDASESTEAPISQGLQPVATPSQVLTQDLPQDPPLPPPPAPLGLDDADPQAVIILASLRIVDRRLILSRSEVAELAPAVAEWLAQGLNAEEITHALTTGLPAHFRARPARVLAFRLREAPLPVPPKARPAVTVTPLPLALQWQNCDGCERAFRGTEQSTCRDCRTAGAA
ncbi:hypothetical protein PV396_36470 [Streptomyces sp. ME02-8801-2C]|uniref:hypothetical protein n=1 Tax=Streptomyces sp. ME02-8801-2C TaxID=3028680 RepID=UPI0029B15D6D|nr:hypothetical protein [Streptomyces sp. ME02-8801-2C]MDX3457391.1 hypothetical protein [Streptomyces sp. ME02-8801-2C]